MDEIRNLLLDQETTLPYFYDYLNDPYAQAVLKLKKNGDLNTNLNNYNELIGFKKDYIKNIWEKYKNSIDLLKNNGQFVEIRLEKIENRKNRRLQLYIYYFARGGYHYYVLSHFYFPKLIYKILNKDFNILEQITDFDIPDSLDEDSTDEEISEMEKTFSKHLNLIQYLLLEKLPFSIKHDKSNDLHKAFKFSRIAISLRTLVNPIPIEYEMKINEKELVINPKNNEKLLVFEIGNENLEPKPEKNMKMNDYQKYFITQQTQKDRELFIYWYLKTQKSCWNEKEKSNWLEQHYKMEDLYDQFCYEIKINMPIQKDESYEEMKSKYNRKRVESIKEHESCPNNCNKPFVLPDIFGW